MGMLMRPSIAPINRFKHLAFTPTALNSGAQRRGMQPETEYGKKEMGPLYDPQVHHPLLVPTTADAYPDWDLAYFKSVVDKAEPGKFVVLQFHGVPDIAHPWVHTDQEKFKEYMRYLKDNEFKVISLKDVLSFLPENYTSPDDPLIGYRWSTNKVVEYFTQEQRATRENLDFWVDNMRRFHNFSWEEVAKVTGYSVEGNIQKPGAADPTRKRCGDHSSLSRRTASANRVFGGNDRSDAGHQTQYLSSLG